MDELADKKLAQRFKDVFDEHVDDGAAEGWTKFRERQKPARKPVPLYWISGLAAMLLLTFGLGWYFGTRNEVREEQVAQADKQTPRDKNAGENSADPQQSPAVPEKAGTADTRTKKTGVKTAPVYASAASGRMKSTTDHGRSMNSIADASPLSTGNLAQASLFHPVFSHALSPAEVKNLNLVPQAAGVFPPMRNAKETAPQQNERITPRTFALAVFAGPQLNYGPQNTRRQALPTGGVQAELALGRHFSVGLSAGISDYQLAYNNGLPPVGGSAAPVSAATLDVATAAASTPAKRTPSFVKTTARQVNSDRQSFALVSASTIEISTVTARFTAIEMPLSLSWKPAFGGKPALSLTAAVNSTWMIREAYTADFSLQGTNPVALTPRLPEEKSEDAFTAFTPFSSLQFSVGFQPAGANSRFAIEPFARFPLQNQGIEQLRYGSAGLNLKFRLTGSVKKTK